MTWAYFDIQISKFVVAKLHFAKVGKTYNSLIFPTHLGNIFYENWFIEERQILDTNANIIISFTCFHKLHGQMIFNNQQAHIFKNVFLLHLIFLERIFGSKKIGNYVIISIWFFCLQIASPLLFSKDCSLLFKTFLQ
jgi:hypothetical protein